MTAIEFVVGETYNIGGWNHEIYIGDFDSDGKTVHRFASLAENRVFVVLDVTKGTLKMGERGLESSGSSFYYDYELNKRGLESSGSSFYNVRTGDKIYPPIKSVLDEVRRE